MKVQGDSTISVQKTGLGVPFLSEHPVFLKIWGWGRQIWTWDNKIWGWGKEKKKREREEKS